MVNCTLSELFDDNTTGGIKECNYCGICTQPSSCHADEEIGCIKCSDCLHL